MKNKLKIYYSGNELFKEDSMPFEIIPILKKEFPQIEFVHHDPSENVPEEEKNLIIIDTVINTKKVVVVENEKQLITEDIYTPHDWDLAFNLKLLLKLKKIDGFYIIGVPPKGNPKEIADDVGKIIYSQFIFKK